MHILPSSYRGNIIMKSVSLLVQYDDDWHDHGLNNEPSSLNWRTMVWSKQKQIIRMCKGADN